MGEARKAAGERAAAQITKFFERGASNPQLADSIQRAFTSKGSTAEAMPAEAQRRLATSIADLTRAYANGTLKEVRFTSPGYDDKMGQVLVRVGITRAPAAVAAGMAGGLTEPPPAPGSPVPVGGKIEEPTQVKYVPAIYPPIAQTARVQGTVLLAVPSH